MRKVKVVVKGKIGNHSVYMEDAPTVALENKSLSHGPEPGHGQNVYCQAVDRSMHEQGGTGEKVGASTMDLGLDRLTRLVATPHQWPSSSQHNSPFLFYLCALHTRGRRQEHKQVRTVSEWMGDGR